MRTIPQRDLRNNSATVLRQAEEGEEFIITVDGRPVAMLGPYRKRQWVSRDSVHKMLATPTDPRSLDDIRRGISDDVQDPWAS